jgi:hypothetical protein
VIQTAIHLRMTPRQFLRSVSSPELSELMAEYELSPWGQLRDDLRTAIVASTVANSAPFRKKGAKPKSLMEFMPYQKAPRVEQTWEQMKLRAQFLTRVYSHVHDSKS